MLMFYLGVMLLAGVAMEIMETNTRDTSGDEAESPEGDSEIDTNSLPIVQLDEQTSLPLAPPASIMGTSEHDWIVGAEEDESIIGGGGDDMLEGMEGDDTVEGEDGNDFLVGGVGRDVLLGGAGNDFLDGRDETPEQIGIDGAGHTNIDYLFGGEGNDVLVLDREDQAEGGGGADVFILDGTEYLLTYATEAVDCSGASRIVDFDSNQDRIIVTYPDDYTGDGVISIIHDEQNEGYSLIILDNVEIGSVYAATSQLRECVLLLPESSFEPAHVGTGGAWR